MANLLRDLVENQLRSNSVSIQNNVIDWSKIYKRANRITGNSVVGSIPSYDKLGVYDATWDQPLRFGRACYWTSASDYLNDHTSQSTFNEIADIAKYGGDRRSLAITNIISTPVLPDSLVLLDEEIFGNFSGEYWAQRITWVKERQPSLKVGIFGVPWDHVRDHEWIYRNQAAAKADIINGISTRRAEVDASDYIAYDIYMLGPSQYEINRDLAVRQVQAEAFREVFPDKPIVPLMLGYFEPGNPTIEINGSKLDQIIRTNANTFDGVIIWGHWSYNSTLVHGLLTSNLKRLRKGTWASA